MSKSWSLTDLPAKYQEQAKAQMPERIGIPAAFKRKKGRPEGEFQDAIIEALQTRGYIVAHFRPAKVTRDGKETYETPVAADGKGYPDLIAIHPPSGRCVVIEVKSETGTVSDAQLEWLRAFTSVQSVHTVVLRPSAWRDFEALL